MSEWRYEIRRASGEVVDRAMNYSAAIRALRCPEAVLGTAYKSWRLDLWDMEAGVLIARRSDGQVSFGDQVTA